MSDLDLFKATSIDKKAKASQPVVLYKIFMGLKHEKPRNPGLEHVLRLAKSLNKTEI